MHQEKKKTGRETKGSSSPSSKRSCRKSFSAFQAVFKSEREQKFDEAGGGVVGHHHPLLCRVFALTPIYTWPECGPLYRNACYAG